MDPNIPYQHSFQIPLHQATPRKTSGSAPLPSFQSPGSQLHAEANMHAQYHIQQQPTPQRAAPPHHHHHQQQHHYPPHPQQLHQHQQPQPQQHEQRQERRREWIPAPLDAEDALQYSPLSSIALFPETSLIIPLPTINTTGQVPLRDTIGENLLSNLNLEASRDASSQTVSQALQELSGYLRRHPGKIYKFKQPTVLDPALAPPSNDNLNIPSAIKGLIRTSKLGRFEGLLLRNNHDFLQQTAAPAQQDEEMVKKKVRRKSSLQTVDPRNLQSVAPATPTLKVPPKSPYATTTPIVPGAVPFQSPAKSTPAYPTPSPGGLHFSVNIPQRTGSTSISPQPPLPPVQTVFSPATTSQTPANQSPRRLSTAQYSPGGTRILQSVMIASPPAFDRAAYDSHPDVDQNVLAGKGTGMRKRKRALDDEDDDVVTGVDYRAKAKQALTSLSNLIANIFNAEDNMQADTSERTMTKTSNYFLTSSYDSENSHGPCLAIATQTKLDSVLQKVISAGKFDVLPVDDLVRLQKICENTLKTAEDIEIKITDEILGGDTSAWDSWLGRVGWIDNALRTSMTCLRIMTGGRVEKQVYSEELLQSILNTVKTLLDTCMNQLIEARPSSSQQLFKSASSQRKILNGVLHEIVLVFKLLARFINAEEVTDEFITKMEYICVGIIFIENATHEKESVFGIQKVENLRAAAMDVLAIVFAKYPDQQKFIFDELLSNLEKLPTSKSGARNFKLASGGDIQLITALILILIQTSGTYRADTRKERGIPALNPEAGKIVTSPTASQSQNPEADTNTDDPERNSIGIVKSLKEFSKTLSEAATRNASYVSSFMIQRAQTSSKTGETPYRNLLDLVINDLLTVLRLPEWPAAELMLRTIEIYMVNIVDDPKAQSNPRGMALDVLTTMAVSVCDMRVHIRESQAKGEGQNEFDLVLQQLTKEYISLYHEGAGERRDEKEDLNKRLMSWEGPFKLVLEQLWEKDDSSTGSLRSAWGFYATMWSYRLCAYFESLPPEDRDDDEGIEIASIGVLLRNIMKGNAWYDEQRNLDNFNKITPTPFQVRHAYQLTVMTTPFCASFERIFDRFIRCVESDSISTRNKGLKAIKQLIEKDSSILDRQQTLNSMMLRSEDPSAQVRDSAVDMIGTCLSFKPGLEDKVLPYILNRVSDTNVGVRKRAMKVSKEIYLHSENIATKVRVAECLMLRVKDMDNSVAELAKKTFEELWINPSYAQIMKPSDDQREVSAKAMMIIKDRIDIIVKVAQGQDGQAIIHLNNVIQAFLDKENKQDAVNAKVCKIMVQALFDEILDHVSDNNDNSDKKDKQFILKTLTAFAQGSARLFNVQQLETLRPYIENLSKQDDLFMYRSVIIIFRCVLPSLSSAHQNFLMSVAKSLLTNLSLLSHRELKEVIFCLAAINKVQDINVRLVAVICSCFASVVKFAKVDTNALDKGTIGRVSRFIYIMGLLGMYCDFEKFKEGIRNKLKPAGLDKFTGSIAQLVVDTILSFCKPNVEMTIRKAALESLGHVCKTHPIEYLRPTVLEPMNTVFSSDDADLKKLVLSSVLDFFTAEEKLSEDAAQDKGPAASKESVTNDDFDPGRLTGATAFAASHDGVCASLAQLYLKSIVKMALASNDEYALTAAEVIGSILRQGLVHPKDCTPALIALETSTQPRIEQIALKEHKMLAAKHESIVERSYMEGVRTAFSYQKDIIGNVEGTKPGTNIPILASLYAMVQSNRKVRKKLLHNMVQSLDFDLAKFDPDAKDLPPILYGQFMLYNLCFFDYGSIEDVQTVVQSLERLVTGTGTAVAHQMESDIIQLGKQEPQPVDPQVRKKLCAASIILMMAWSVRSYLRKLYGFNDPKRKVATKDVTKTATKVQGVSPEPLRTEINEMTSSMDTELGQDEQCRAFIDMLNVDKDFKLAAENDEDLAGSGQEDDSDGPGIGTPASGTKKRKRQGSPPARKKKVIVKKHRASSEISDGS